MNLSADKLERLQFVKFLLAQAERQKELGRPSSSATILTLHDLVECFLQLALEHFTKKHKLSSTNILDTYAEELNKELVVKELPIINKAFIKRLNELRNQLKHVTIFLDKKNITNIYSETETFLSDYTKIFFEFSLDDISLLHLIHDETIRKHLLEAEKLLSQNELHNALLAVGKAFYEYKVVAIDLRDRQGYPLVNTSFRRANYTRRLELSLGSSNVDSALKSGLSEIAKDIDEIRKELNEFKKVQLLSVDMSRYILFEDIVPYISKIDTYDDAETQFEYYIPTIEWFKQEKLSIDQVKLCFDFVVDIVFAFENKAYA